jgi:hypothetical protein
MYPRYIGVFDLQGKPVCSQKPSEEIFGTILAITSCEQQGFDRRMILENFHQISQYHLLHPHIRRVYFLAISSLHNITDPYSPLIQERFALFYGLGTVLIDQVKVEQSIQNGPKLTITAAIAKIDIALA